ncbi:MAG: hypothetical protein JXA10_06305 [Anaerolineae bacterium]|nr:hypothetical protein [Anaerolineae bacterium]
MKLSSLAHKLHGAFAEPGCPVCRLTADSVHHYLGSLIYEYVNKVPTHMAIRAARGFCTNHAWHALEQITPSHLGIAILYEGLVRNMLKDMGEITPNSGRRQVNQAAKALKSQAECPACTHRATVEDQLLRNLLEHIDQPEFAEAYEQSAGVCLHHLRMGLDQSGYNAEKAQLVALQQTIWGKLQHHLAEYIRLSDERYAEEDMGEPGTSPRRAIEQMAGKKNLW